MFDVAWLLLLIWFVDFGGWSGLLLAFEFVVLIVYCRYCLVFVDLVAFGLRIAWVALVFVIGCFVVC